MAHIESISLEDNFAFISQYRLCETQWRRVADFSDLTRRRRTRTGWDGYRVHYKIRETRLPSRRRSHLARRKEGGYLNDVCPKNGPLRVTAPLMEQHYCRVWVAPPRQ